MTSSAQLKAPQITPESHFDSTLRGDQDALISLHCAENEALCLARGLRLSSTPPNGTAGQEVTPDHEQTRALWESLAAQAHATLNRFLAVAQSSRHPDELVVLDGNVGEPLRTAARILDLYAQHAPSSGPHVARTRNLGAACAFGASGNGPSALVAMRRALPTLRPHTGTQAALLLVCAPSLISQTRDHITRLEGGSAACAALEAFLTSGAPELMPVVTATWENLSACAPSSEADLPLALARICLQQTLRLSTASALRTSPIAPQDTKRLVEALPVLLPPQWNALRCGLLHEPENAVISLRPSTGKTLLGELCALAALPADGLVVFIAPYIALGRQTAAALEAHLPSTIRVHRLLGGHEAPHANFAHGRHIAVATPERLDTLLRWQPTVRASLRAVICDEAHLIADGARGVRLEGVLSRLRLWQQAATFPSNTTASRIVLLSAATGHADELSTWLDAPPGLRIRDEWAPTARRVALWAADGQLSWHDPHSGTQLGANKVAWPHPLQAAERWPQMQRVAPKARANVAHLARHLYETQGGSVLCVSATREGARQLACAMAQVWLQGAEPRGARAQAMALIAERYAFLEPLRACLARGVAWHNGTLPYPIRALLEDAVREGELGAVASTTTLAEGVDLPFRWTLLADWLHWDTGTSTPQLQPMSRALWRNIAGRCGRAGVYTEGDTIVFDNPLGPLEFTAPETRSSWHHAYLSGAEPAAPVSALEISNGQQPSAEVCDAWAAQVLAAVAENPDVPGLSAKLCAASYAAHRPTDLAPLQALTSTIYEDLLAGGFAQRGLNGGLVLTPLGNAANTTGLSPQACQRIVEALHELRGPRSLFDAWGTEDEGEFPVERVAREVSSLLLATCAVASAPDALRRLTRGRSRSPLRSADLPRVLESWFAGFAPEDLFAQLPGGRDLNAIVEEFSTSEGGAQAALQSDVAIDSGIQLIPVPGFDRFADWLRTTLENWAPWLCRAAALLEPFARPAETTAWPWAQWASWCETGVSTPWALEAVRRDAPGGRRSLSILGEHWPTDWAGDFDPLGIIPLRTERGRFTFEKVVRDSLRVVGGRYTPDGKGVLLARDWIQARALNSAANTHQANSEHVSPLPATSQHDANSAQIASYDTTVFFRSMQQHG